MKVEEVILGACLLESTAPRIVMNILQEGSFTTDFNKSVFRAIKKLYDRGHPIDLITISPYFKGQEFFLTELTNDVASTANLEYHCRILEQERIKRTVIEACRETLVRLRSEEPQDIFDVIDNLSKATKLDFNQLSKPKLVSEIKDEFIHDITRRADHFHSGTTMGLPTYLEELKPYVPFFEPGDLVYLSARPSMGKSLVGMNHFALQAAKDGKRVAAFTFETGRLALLRRMAASELMISATDLKEGRLTSRDLDLIQDWIETFCPNLLITDRACSISEIESISKDSELIVIDQFHFINEKKGVESGNEYASRLSRDLKHTAQKLQVPILCLHQLNRSVETRGGMKRPMMSDLRDSGSFEQDADVILLLYRPEYYGILNDEEGNSLKDVLEIIIGKNREGSVGTAKTTINLDYQKIGVKDLF